MRLATHLYLLLISRIHLNSMLLYEAYEQTDAQSYSRNYHPLLYCITHGAYNVCIHMLQQTTVKCKKIQLFCTIPIDLSARSCRVTKDQNTATDNKIEDKLLKIFYCLITV